MAGVCLIRPSRAAIQSNDSRKVAVQTLAVCPPPGTDEAEVGRSRACRKPRPSLVQPGVTSVPTWKPDADLGESPFPERRVSEMRAIRRLVAVERVLRAVSSPHWAPSRPREFMNELEQASPEGVA